MQFLITAYDRTDAPGRRLEVRPRHLANIAGIRDKVICAGGLLDEEGNMKGSALVMEFPDRAGVEDYLSTEPYVTEGVWERVQVEPMNVVILGGEKVGK